MKEKKPKAKEVKEPKVEVSKVEVSKVEEPKVEVSKVQEPKVEVSKVEVSKVQEPKVEVKGEEPKVKVEGEEPKAKEPKVKPKPKLVLDIIRGRMPFALVHAIKFLEPEVSDKVMAEKYKTTLGKITDIRKSKNFRYITEEFKYDQEMIRAAEFRCKSYEQGLEIMKIINSRPVATAEDMLNYQELRKGTRSVNEQLAASPKKEKVKVSEVETMPEIEVEADVEIDKELADLLG